MISLWTRVEIGRTIGWWKGRGWNGDCRSWICFWLVQQWTPSEGIRELRKSPLGFRADGLNPQGHGQITRGESAKDILPTLRASDIPWGCCVG